MQYGVTGAISNTSTNLLMLALPAQPEVLPTGSDFTVQLERSNQTCSVAVLPDQTSGADVLVQVSIHKQCSLITA